MNGTARKPPDFSLLIGKRLGKKKGEGDGPPTDLGEDAVSSEGDGKDMALSAMKDFIAAVHAKSPEAASAALGDFLELSDKDDEPPAEEEPPPPPE